MKINVVMPKMGESLQEGTIIKWLKKPGDKVERDEMILEISTDKVDTEVPSPASGVLTRVLFEENQVVEVGKVIAEIETDASAAVTAEPTPAPVLQQSPVIEVKAEFTQTPAIAAPDGNLVDVVMPKMGESLQEGTITKWLKKIGDKIERDEMILEISTDKVDTEVPSPVSGILAEMLAQESETVEVGKVIARISTSGAISPAPKVQAEPTVSAPIHETAPAVAKSIEKSSGKRFYSPLVRTIAKEHNVSIDELDTISGTGLEGRVNKKDILAYIELRKSVGAKPAAVPSPSISQAKPAQEIKPTPTAKSASIPSGQDVEIIPMDRVRQLISEHMVYSKHTSAHVTSVTEADVTGIVKFRESFKDEFFKREGIKLTFTPFFAKATIDALVAHPMVNVSVEGNNIIRYRRINLGMATALPDKNLIVPVIKNAEMLNLTGLQRSVTDLAERARSKKLNPDDIQGGTFTITNYGTAGTLFGSPIINQPQTAILGIGTIQKRPVVREINGEYLIVIRDMVYLSLTYDHRVIDGQLAGETLQTIVASLQSMNENTISM